MTPESVEVQAIRRRLRDKCKYHLPCIVCDDNTCLVCIDFYQNAREDITTLLHLLGCAEAERDALMYQMRVAAMVMVEGVGAGEPETVDQIAGRMLQRVNTLKAARDRLAAENAGLRDRKLRLTSGVWAAVEWEDPIEESRTRAYQAAMEVCRFLLALSPMDIGWWDIPEQDTFTRLLRTLRAALKAVE